MTFKEAEKILREITMSCWWPSKAFGRRTVDVHGVVDEARLWLRYPVDTERKRQVEEAIGVITAAWRGESVR